MASLYTTAIMQLGLDPQSGQMKYQPDIIAARQTVDMLSILQEKTKGNLDAKETRLLDSILYELRMAYIEITKMLTPGSAPAGRQRQRLMQATLTVLGSGTSMGVPTVGCDCAVCHSHDPRDRRTRPSIMVQFDGTPRADRYHA